MANPNYVKVVTNVEHGWDCIVDVFKDIPDNEIWEILAGDAGKVALSEDEKGVHMIFRKRISV